MTRRLKIFAGTLAGAGYLPLAPGTWGSLLTLPLIYPAALYGGTPGVAAGVLAASLLTLWAADACESKWGPDPSRMVMDEFAGQALVFLFVPFTGNLSSDAAILAAGFLFFRIFDIAKPFAINRLQHFESGLGILLDDLAAGLYSLVCLHLGLWLFSLL